MLFVAMEATKIQMAYVLRGAVWVSFWKISTFLNFKVCFTQEHQDYLDNQWTLLIYNVIESRFLSTIPRRWVQVKSQ